MTTFRTLAAFGALGGATLIAAVMSAAPEKPIASGEMEFFDDMTGCFSNESVAAIVDEGTDPAIAAQVYNMILKQFEEQQSNSRYFVSSRWPVGSIGNPVNVTYSFPADGITMDAGAGNPNVLHADLTGTFLTEAAWKDLFRQVFDRWEEITGNTYTEVSDDNAFWGASGPIHGGSGRGDIRLWSRSIDGASNVLAFNFFPGSGVGGDMVLDSGENWGGGAAQNFRFFRNVVAHENGHGMGLRHVCTDTGHRALMNPFLSTTFDGPQHDDIRGMQRQYGDFNEPNGNIATATDLGFFNPLDSASVFGASVSGSEDDYYGVTVSGSSLLDVTVSPVGVSYNNGPQAGDGSCPLGPVIDTLALHDLRVRVLNAAGGEIANVNANPAGLPEFVVDATLGSGGTFYVVVDSLDTFVTETQLYNISVNVTIPLPDGDLNSDCIVDTADLGGLIGAFGGSGPFGDINGDGVVDTADLGILISNFGATCTGM